MLTPEEVEELEKILDEEEEALGLHERNTRQVVRNRVQEEARPKSTITQEQLDEMIIQLKSEELAEERASLVTKIKEMMTKEFEQDFSHVEETSKLGEIGVDSLGFMEFLFVVEEEFKINIETESVEIPSTFGDMITFLHFFIKFPGITWPKKLTDPAAISTALDHEKEFRKQLDAEIDKELSK